MTKPLTYYKPSGEWGIEGVDLSALPPQVYGALAKLMHLEHPLCENRADQLRLASEEEMAELLGRGPCLNKDGQCLEGHDCKACWLNWLYEPMVTTSKRIAPQKDNIQWKDWLKTRFERREV